MTVIQLFANHKTGCNCGPNDTFVCALCEERVGECMAGDEEFIEFCEDCTKYLRCGFDSFFTASLMELCRYSPDGHVNPNMFTIDSYERLREQAFSFFMDEIKLLELESQDMEELGRRYTRARMLEPKSFTIVQLGRAAKHDKPVVLYYNKEGALEAKWKRR